MCSYSDIAYILYNNRPLSRSTRLSSTLAPSAVPPGPPTASTRPTTHPATYANPHQIPSSHPDELALQPNSSCDELIVAARPARKTTWRLRFGLLSMCSVRFSLTTSSHPFFSIPPGPRLSSPRSLLFCILQELSSYPCTFFIPLHFLPTTGNNFSKSLFVSPQFCKVKPQRVLCEQRVRCESETGAASIRRESGVSAAPIRQCCGTGSSMLKCETALRRRSGGMRAARERRGSRVRAA